MSSNGSNPLPSLHVDPAFVSSPVVRLLQTLACGWAPTGALALTVEVVAAGFAGLRLTVAAAPSAGADTPAAPTVYDGAVPATVAFFNTFRAAVGSVWPADRAAQAEIERWMTETSDTAAFDLARLAAHLSASGGRSAVVGTQISVADLWSWFHLVESGAAATSPAQIAQSHPAVFRWAHNIAYRLFTAASSVNTSASSASTSSKWPAELTRIDVTAWDAALPPVNWSAALAPVAAASSCPASCSATAEKPVASADHSKAKECAAPVVTADSNSAEKSDTKTDKKADKKVADKKADKKADKPAEKGAEKSATPAAAAVLDPSVLDIRVGFIRKVWRHPDAQKLYCEEIDVGEEQPRQVCSGLVDFFPEDQMLNRRVLVLCNLKPATMRGVKSAAMVLCASNADHTKVGFVNPPAEAAVGSLVQFEGFSGKPEAQLNAKKVPALLEQLNTDAECQARFGSARWTINGQSCLCPDFPSSLVK